MSRADVQMHLNQFFGRAGCVSIADCDLARTYLASLKAYIEQLEGEFDPIDPWSVQELQRVNEYLFHNRQWASNCDTALVVLGEAFSAIERHQDFLASHGLLPEHLREGPNNSFKPKPLRGSA